MHIGVVGGSIAGCSAAVELRRSGHEISVIERSRGGLRGRGAGIGTPADTFQSLVDRDLIDADTPRMLVSDHPFVGRGTSDNPLGHIALTLPLNMALVNWGDLWNQLRARVPDGIYTEGLEVSSFATDGDQVVIAASDGWEERFDLVLFADGYASLGRQELFPDTELSYRGYVLWRGVLDEIRLSDARPLETALYRIHYGGLPGNAVFYFVPGRGGSTEPGSRWVNWACYIPVEPQVLPDFLVDREGRAHEHSLPPGSMRAEEEDRLKRLMGEYLPSYFADIVAASTDTFAQPIFAVTVPGYARGRVALLGDAGSVAPPFTGSGVFKAVGNAVDLADSLTASDDVDNALHQWSREQTQRGARLAALGEQMEEAFVWSAPDFSTMTEAQTRKWWSQAVTFPEEFSYLSED